MKNKHNVIEETSIGGFINKAADVWGRLLLGEKSSPSLQIPFPERTKKLIKSLDTGKGKKT